MDVNKLAELTGKRKFMLTSHGALHRPGCYSLTRLKIPPTEVWLDPNYIRPHDSFPAECCWQYANTTTGVYRWRFSEELEDVVR